MFYLKLQMLGTTNAYTFMAKISTVGTNLKTLSWSNMSTALSASAFDALVSSSVILSSKGIAQFLLLESSSLHSLRGLIILCPNAQGWDTWDPFTCLFGLGGEEALLPGQLNWSTERELQSRLEIPNKTDGSSLQHLRGGRTKKIVEGARRASGLARTRTRYTLKKALRIQTVVQRPSQCTVNVIMSHLQCNRFCTMTALNFVCVVTPLHNSALCQSMHSVYTTSHICEGWRKRN